MTTRKLLLMAGIAIAVLQGCSDGYKTSDEGLKYKIYTKNEGAKIQEGDYLTLHMVYRTDSDSVLFDTYKMGQPIKLIVSAPTFKGDLMHGLMLLTEKDSATFLVNADSLFEKTFHFDRPKFIAAGSNLKFDVKIEKVVTKAKMEEEMKAANEKQIQLQKENIAKYIADNKLSPTTTASGLMYVIHKDGKGEIPAAGDTVVVHYEGKLLNGNKFDSSYDVKRPLEFPLGEGTVMPGWEEAFTLMKKGTKATLIIPFELAYGSRDMRVIPPYSTLVFDVELLNIKKKK